ncbi:MAG: DUF6036 family nucleotidyltransferase [Mycobacteriales bacterium]
MDRAEILAALTALGEQLQRDGVVADLYVVGGAAIALAYDDRRSTRDIDAVFVPKILVYQAAARVAADRGLPVGWLNDAVKGFLLGPDRFPTEILDLPGLRVEVASAQTVLVMKCLAHRVGEDDDDLRLLAGHLRLQGAAEVLDLVARMAGPRLLTPQVQFFVEAVLDAEPDATGGGR